MLYICICTTGHHLPDKVQLCDFYISCYYILLIYSIYFLNHQACIDNTVYCLFLVDWPSYPFSVERMIFTYLAIIM